MLRGKLVLKLTALVVAIGLGGVFIAYRAGAFQPPAPQPEPQPQSEAQPQPQASETPKPVSWNELTPEEREKIIMYGSKSAPVLTPVSPSTGATSPSPQPSTTANPNSPSYMGGSKSIIVVESKDVPKPPQAQPIPPQPVKP